uniref:Uncharacterized protein n=1 Tax=Ananas comosus var. bracteatus TaxID=296719 RepID=A0A6V7NLX0_ANACO|nr:unnamed protein product [Ananas comosus var. bracteatus]
MNRLFFAILVAVISVSDVKSCDAARLLMDLPPDAIATAVAAASSANVSSFADMIPADLPADIPPIPADLRADLPAVIPAIPKLPNLSVEIPDFSLPPIPSPKIPPLPSFSFLGVHVHLHSLLSSMLNGHN